MQKLEIVGVEENLIYSYNVRYVHYLGYGDSKAFKSVLEDIPYGSDVVISKLGCIQKCIGFPLWQLKMTYKGKT